MLGGREHHRHSRTRVVRVDVRGRKSRAPDCTPQPQLRDAAEACCQRGRARRRNGSPSIRPGWKRTHPPGLN